MGIFIEWVIHCSDAWGPPRRWKNGQEISRNDSSQQFPSCRNISGTNEWIMVQELQSFYLPEFLPLLTNLCKMEQ